MGLFDAPTGGEAVNLTSGSPEYQNAIMGNVQRQLKPAYQQALQQTRQNMSSRGLLDSGLGAQAELGLQQGYLNKAADVATQAATQGADVTEQNRRAQQQREWAVQDRDIQLAELRDQAHRAEEQAGADRWANLLGGAAGAAGTLVGTAVGGPLGGWLGGMLGNSTKGKQTPTAPSSTAPVSGPYNTGLGNQSSSLNSMNDMSYWGY